MSSRQPKVSVIAPILNEAEALPELIDRLRKLREDQPGYAWEFLLVDDGSTDASLPLLREAARADDDFKVLALSRNFGHQPAITAGLDFCDGDAVAIIDSDLQDPPEIIPEMLEVWKQGAEVVSAVRRSRQEHLAKRLSYKLFYRVLRWASRIDIQLDSGDCCVMDRSVVEVLRQIPDRSRFLRGLRAWVGFDQRAYYYDRAARTQGESKYSVRKLAALALDGLVSFSELPLRLGTWTGLALVGFSLAYAIVAGTLSIISWDQRPRGFATLAITMTFLSGVQLVVISLLGEYVIRIFHESKKRPVYVVREARNLPEPRSDAERLGVLASASFARDEEQ